jgi:DNA-binding transcriptional MerR regulator
MPAHPEEEQMDARITEGAFTSGQACRLSGVAYRTLDYWAASGFLPPSAQETEGKGTWRGYSFTDIVQLRVAKRLREAGISLQGLRKVQQRLRQERNLDAPLAETYLLTNGTDVFEVKRGQREVWSILRQPGQRGFPWVILDLSQTVADVREQVEAEQRKVGLS